MKPEVQLQPVSDDLLPQLAGSDAITATAVARREAETIRVAMMTAIHRPRDEEKRRAAAIQAFARPIVAEDAEYVFPRGGAEVRGVSVYAAREIARHWHNVQFGGSILSQDAREVHVGAWAWDLETNQRVTAEDRFNKLQQRKNKRTGETEWVMPDERDLRELVNKRIALLTRNCILQIVPSDLVDECIERAHRTTKDAAAAAKKDDPTKASKQRAKLLSSFEGVGVTRGMLEAYLAHDFDATTPEEYVHLVGIGKSLKDGEAKVADFFTVSADEPAAAEQPAQTDAPPQTMSDLMKGAEYDEQGKLKF